MEGISSRGQLTRGGLPACRLGVGLTTPYRKTFLLLRNVSKRLGLGRILWHELSNGKRDMRFGTWNVRSLYRVGAIKSVVGELEKYKLDLVE
jgi:hypothetical protein